MYKRQDISKLAGAGMYKVRPLLWLTGAWQGATAAWPVSTLPAWTAPVGGVDKKDKPNEKRRISNGSWPYGLPRTREGPHGEPTGPTCRSFNELAGPMQPPDGATPPTEHFEVTAWGEACDFCAKLAVAPRGRTYSRCRPTTFDRAHHHRVRTFYRVRDALDHHRGGDKSAFSTRCDGGVQRLSLIHI